MRKLENPELRAKLPTEGPWVNEPDEASWQYEDGYLAVAWRHPHAGHWCGYLSIPEGHPWRISNTLAEDVTIHGGVTFRGLGEHMGHPKHFFVGFDCHHPQDLGPLDLQHFPAKIPPGTYRDFDYVRLQIDLLHLQAVKAAEV